MKSQLLIGATAFMARLREQAQIAQNRLYVQAMTFEGDQAGKELIDLMVMSKAADRRLLIDSFSKVVVSDHFVWGLRFLKDAGFRWEIENGKRLIERARANGVKVEFTNPMGVFMWKYPLRNHKKMMVADGVSFLGGINFSEHNFAWHDMMVELEDDEFSNDLAQDFLTTWAGGNQSTKKQLDRGELYFLNGVKSENVYRELFSHLLSASKSIRVISPYVSEPLFGILIGAAKNAVRVEVYSPLGNNKSIFKKYLISEWSKGYFDLYYSEGMSHLKAILIDDSKLIFGSSNFDVVSYYFEQEVVMVSEEVDLINQFTIRVLSDLQRKSTKYEGEGSKSGKASFQMSALSVFCRLASHSILKPYD